MKQPRNFARLFAPRSIAVVGASTDEASISGQPIRFLRQHGYPGRVFPVNPKYPSVGGHEAYPDVASLPEAPDVALVAVGAARVLDALRALAARGTPFAIILTSGFAESGDEGQIAQDEIARIARDSGMRVVGPNCQGMMNIAEGYALGFGPPFGLKYCRGAVSLTSQSGAFGNSVLMLADEEGMGFRHYQSTGNESDVTTLDLVEHFIADAGTRVIACYVEGLRDARRLVDLGRRALVAGKPLLMWKVGNSEAGASAAASHTANLGGAPMLYRAAFTQAGILEVTDVTDLADCVHALEYAVTSDRLPRGNRIAVVTISGGAGILTADRCSDAGLILPKLAPATVEGLRACLPSFAAVGNPVDVTAGVLADPAMFGRALRLIAADPNVDMLALPLAAISGKTAFAAAREIVALTGETRIPIMVAWNGPQETTREAYQLLADAGIPRYRTPVRCARGFAALWQWTQARRQQAETPAPAAAARNASLWRERLAGRGDIAEHEAKRVLADWGIAPTREILATTRDEAVRCARQLGFPVVLKVQSPSIPHKTEAGGVRVGLASDAEVAAAYDEIVGNAGRHAPQAALEGVLVQEMVAGGTEVILGVSNDPLFGPAIMFGLGGIFTEVMKDVSFRLAPVTRDEALRMVREIRAFPILDGARGKPLADIEALACAIVALSGLALDLEHTVAELDINPLFVFPRGQGVKAGDALIRTHPKNHL